MSDDMGLLMTVIASCLFGTLVVLVIAEDMERRSTNRAITACIVETQDPLLCAVSIRGQPYEERMK